jgi:flagellar protein FliS
MASGYNVYQRTQITTSDRRKLIVLLYEGAISRLNQATAALEADDADRRVMNVNKALDIIHFLNNALDFERGGDISKNLQRLYDYTRDVISQGNIEARAEKFGEAIRLLNLLLEAWRQIASNGSATTPASLEERAQEMVMSIAATG